MNEFIDLIPEFVEESLEHLKNIEEDIIIIEQGNADNELINRVFRAVHSIKGGSSFLGLRNIERLSHKMEDIFNLVRNDELTFSSDISSCVLTSIDRLREMLAHSGDSDSYDISGNLEALSRCLGQKSMDDIARKIKKDIEESTVKIDQSKLAHLRKQGKKVYMVHFELRDDQLGSKRPLDFFGEIEKTGDVLVRNVDMELVLRDAEFTGQGIPLNILYATVLERDLVAHIFAIDEKQVKEIKPDSLMEEEVIESAGADEAEIDEAYYVEMESYLKRKGSIDDVAPAAEEPEPPREPEEEPREIQPRQPLPPDPPPPGDRRPGGRRGRRTRRDVGGRGRPGGRGSGRGRR